MMERFFSGIALAIILFVFFGTLGVFWSWITKLWGGAK
jgi:hypothetical protein